uniref:hypothetical protein n=1 Tax=Flavobacterium sp. TaxID=239 RepID=UPI004049AA6B
MDKYKILFWIAFVSFVSLLCYSYLRKIDYEWVLSSKDWQISDYEFDIRMIDELMFKTDKSEHQIDSILIAYDQSDGDYFKITKDTAFLKNSYLLFEDNQLKSIRNKNEIDK